MSSIVWLIVSGIILVAFIVVIVMIWRFSSKVIHPRTVSKAESYAREVKSGIIDPEKEQLIASEDITILSKYGYSLVGKLFPLENSNKVIILCHGVNCTLFQMYKYRDLYMELGFSVLAYDQRANGDSGGKNVTYGYYEKYDLVSWVNWLRHRSPENTVIGLHGESMGAAVALQAMNLVKVEFCVADSCFSNFSAEAADRFEKKYNINHPIIIELVKIICRIRTGMKFEEVSPVKAVASNVHNTPIMVVHGMLDVVVPPQMGLDIYEKVRETSYKQMFAVVDAAHVESVLKDRSGYLNALKKFLNGCGVR